MMEGEIGRILSKREGKEKKYMRSSQIPKSFPKIAQDVTPQFTPELSRIPPIKPRENNALITRDIYVVF